MKASGRIDGSICGAILFHRSSPRRLQLPGRLLDSPDNSRRHTSPSLLRPYHESRCAYTKWSHITHQAAKNGTTSAAKRFNHAAVAPATAPFWRSSIPQLPQAELLKLVDQTGSEDTAEGHLAFHMDTFLRGYAPTDGPSIRVSYKREDLDFPSPDETNAGSYVEQQILRDLRRAVLLRLRNPSKHSAEDAYQRYQDVPEPRMSYIPARLRHQLLHCLGMAEKKDGKSMMRYFAVIADVKNAGLALDVGEWNAAISFASRYVGRATESETQAALELWREMDQDAGVRGNEVTFNILFDVASKAGNFALADKIYEEMEKRGLPYTRYHHVSLIHYFGLKLDSDGIRAAYKDMVAAGEMIDVVALNCVIAGLLRCGEEDAAEHVYDRMKKSCVTTPLMPNRNFASCRALTKVLMMFSRIGKKHPYMRPQLQASVSMAPDLSTYRILITHHATKLHDLTRVVKYLDEMAHYQVPIHGSIFLAIFRGFAVAGSPSMLPWSQERLEKVWSAFLAALDSHAAGLYIDTWLAEEVLKAFVQCGANDRLYEVYEALSQRWALDEDRKQYMIELLHRLLKATPDKVQVLGVLGNMV